MTIANGLKNWDPVTALAVTFVSFCQQKIHYVVKNANQKSIATQFANIMYRVREEVLEDARGGKKIKKK